MIMAGGEGKRFWPLSSKKKPKQFLSLTGEKSMIRQTVDRILPLIPADNVFVVTVDAYSEETRKHLPDIPRENVITEPVGKNTAPCIAYGTLAISKRFPDCVTVVLPADHAIGDDETFREVLEFACDAACVELDNEEFPLITLGIHPTSPETGYGYIKETKEAVFSIDDRRALRVERFTEKPDLKTAESFIEQGGYYWNSGVFVWVNSSILDEFSHLLPEWYAQFGDISDSIGSPDELRSVTSFYEGIDAGSIDTLILEKSKNTLVIPVSFPWSDLGSWKSLDEYLRKDEDEVIARGETVAVDSSDCLIIGDGKPVAVVGVKDLVVVDSEDGILVLDKNRSQDVKKIVEELTKTGKI